MRVTIIADDSAVYIEEQGQTIDLTGIDEDIHAVQWYGTVGEIEYKFDPIADTRKPNERLEDFSPFQVFVDRWMTETQKIVPAPIPLPPQPQSVLSQDLMAQFTADDAAKIQAAVSANAQFWLLWSAMQAQKDPMLVTNARFLEGWAALVQVLGQARMAAIATALGVTVA